MTTPGFNTIKHF